MAKPFEVERLATKIRGDAAARTAPCIKAGTSVAGFFVRFSQPRRNAVSAKGVAFQGGALVSPKPFLPARSVGGELRAYAREVRAWSTGLLTGYAVAVILLLAAFAGLMGAIAVGLGAFFHLLEMKYGAWIAYGSIGGLLIAIALLAAAMGIAKLRQDMPPPPDPRRHAKAASRIVAAESIGAVAASGQALATRPVLPAAIGLASVGLLGWLIASRLNAGRTHTPAQSDHEGRLK